MKVLSLDLADQPQLMEHMVFVDKPADALDGADALVIVTEWKAYRSPNVRDMKARLKAPIIFDGRNLYDPAVMQKAGFKYIAIGRPMATGR